MALHRRRHESSAAAVAAQVDDGAAASSSSATCNCPAAAATISSGMPAVVKQVNVRLLKPSVHLTSAGLGQAGPVRRALGHDLPGTASELDRPFGEHRLDEGRGVHAVARAVLESSTTCDQVLGFGSGIGSRLKGCGKGRAAGRRLR